MHYHTIRLYPEPTVSELFIRVLVFHRRRAQLAFCRAYGMRGVTARLRAVCMEVDHYYVQRGRPMRKTTLIATVALWRQELGSGLVGHELFHATCAWARRRGFTTTSIGDATRTGSIPHTDVEEQMATVHGELVRQLVDRCYRIKLYPPS